MFIRKYGFLLSQQRRQTLARQRKRATMLCREILIYQEFSFLSLAALEILLFFLFFLSQLYSEECETQRRKGMNLKSWLLLYKYPSLSIREKRKEQIKMDISF